MKAGETVCATPFGSTTVQNTQFTVAKLVKTCNQDSFCFEYPAFISVGYGARRRRASPRERTRSGPRCAPPRRRRRCTCAVPESAAVSACASCFSRVKSKSALALSSSCGTTGFEGGSCLATFTEIGAVFAHLCRILWCVSLHDDRRHLQVRRTPWRTPPPPPSTLWTGRPHSPRLKRRSSPPFRAR